MPDPLSPGDLLTALADRFADVESRDGQVHRVYLNAREVQLLLTPKGRNVFDVSTDFFSGLQGFLWGAEVFVSEAIPPGSVSIVSDSTPASMWERIAVRPPQDTRPVLIRHWPRRRPRLGVPTP